MDFIMGLLQSDEGHNGTLTVVDKAKNMVHLVLVKQIISASEVAHVYWSNI